MNVKIVKRSFKQRNVMALILLSFLLFNISMMGNSELKLITQSDFAEFQFTGNNSFENYDYNNDGLGDILIVNIEVDVSKTGLMMFKNLCNPSVLLWNDSYQENYDSYYYCIDASGSIIELKNLGFMTLTIWYGYGILFPDLTQSSYNFIENANITVDYELMAVSSNGHIASTSITGPSYNFTVKQIHSLSQKISYQGIANTVLSSQNDNLFNGRSASDEYQWKIHQFINFSFSDIVNDDFYFNTHFEVFSSAYVKMVGVQTYENGTYMSNSSLDFFPERGFSSGWNSFLKFLIPVNSDPSSLSLFYNITWKSILERNLDYYENVSNVSITSDVSTNYFGSKFSFEFDSFSNGVLTHYSLLVNVIFHLPTGLLSYFHIFELANSTIYEDITYYLEKPNYGLTKVPVESTQTSSSETSSKISGQTSQTTITTTDFGSNVGYIIIPLLLFSAISRKYKKKNI